MNGPWSSFSDSTPITRSAVSSITETTSLSRLRNSAQACAVLRSMSKSS